MFLADTNSNETAQAVRVLQEIHEWLAELPIDEVKTNQYNAALDWVNMALLETRKYLKHRREGGDRDPDVENRLSKLWFDASSSIRPYNSQLADLSMVKGHGWADETAWNEPENKELPIRVDQMLSLLREQARRPPPLDPSDTPPIPSWFPIAGVIFTALASVSLFYLIVQGEEISTGTRIIFDVWVALCVAASVSFLGGTAWTQGKLPWIGNSPIRFTAVGGVGVFVVVLIIMYSIFH
jgi:hypothetical protein